MKLTQSGSKVKVVTSKKPRGTLIYKRALSPARSPASTAGGARWPARRRAARWT